ncbi:MAG: folate family ECF transporter S component [Lactobacillus sp.]|nr:folate family ECF transporter S component [Lactobacillus sp.]
MTSHKIRKIALLGLMIALKVVLERISFGTTLFEVGLGFIGSVILAYLFGPWWGLVAGGVSDLISSAIFGNAGGFFIGFTLTAMAGPMIYGLVLYRKKPTIWRIILAIVLVCLIVNLGMNSLWLNMMYKEPWGPLLTIRATKQLIIAPIQCVVTYFVLQVLDRIIEAKNLHF